MDNEPLARRLPLTLKPDPQRTVLRPFNLATAADGGGGDGRLHRILALVEQLDAGTLKAEVAATKERLGGRHRAFEATLRRNLESVASLVPGVCDLDEQRALLFGAFVTAEYSFEAAALFNPSVIPHPDQSGLEDGALRLAMSLRGIGEGHVSSITLRSLVWYGDGRLELLEPSTFAVSPEIKWLPGGGARLICADSEDVSESILFPVLPHQSRGLEDMRLVRLVEPNGNVRYLGTYTAVGPDGIGLEILEGHDFRTFDLWPVKGEIAHSKGGALFPRQVDGRYLMISRHDGESLWLAQSDDLVAWDVRQPLMAARWPWEYAQIGNCGSPIELDEGWLLLTHGVGTVRNYSIGACLLDRSDPSRVLARLREPLLKPDDCTRDGYVPNVVYSCGGVVRGGTLLLPYGIADSYTGFAVVDVARLLAAMG